ncbi:T9SS type A sorting domain-containing protein [Dyadobacter sp. CY347]|uniref:T9SS type A sorting domain-containing protein n=1 Tax=Dyadobacter sp. CY347 TaxID=2909336 RepID=UPI001F1A7C73|nr:T9SS type A sorting domain-containing protein [Dyadobacter sp. CY347]MCF2491472.1 T9SS type A sorting domain-containing protein [Dyadobacter sp. CY347]
MKQHLLSCVLSLIVGPYVLLHGRAADSSSLNLNEGKYANRKVAALVTISGHVYHDSNAFNDGKLEGPGTNASGTLYINMFSMLNGIEIAVATVPVNTDGSYQISGDFSGYYQLRINGNQATIGQSSPLTQFSQRWTIFGERLGLGQVTDGLGNGILTIGVFSAQPIVDADFGVQQYPVSHSKTFQIPEPTLNSTIILNGTGSTQSPGPLSGDDVEDGTLGAGKTVLFSLFNNLAGNELHYNGVKLSEGAKIVNYNPALLAIKFTKPSSMSTGFFYQILDNASFYGNAGIYQINWTVLPVTLIKFTASQNEGAVILDWTTSQEENSNHFEIQRSIDGKAWQTLGSVAASGASNDSKHYSFKDISPVKSGLYRLKMVDLDDTFAFSSIQTVIVRDSGNLTFFPNPAQNTLNFSNSKEIIEVKIYNNVGKLMLKTQVPTNGKIDVSALSTGSYVVKVTSKNGSQESLHLAVDK